MKCINNLMNFNTRNLLTVKSGGYTMFLLRVVESCQLSSCASLANHLSQPYCGLKPGKILSTKESQQKYNLNKTKFL